MSTKTPTAVVRSPKQPQSTTTFIPKVRCEGCKASKSNFKVRLINLPGKGEAHMCSSCIKKLRKDSKEEFSSPEDDRRGTVSKYTGSRTNL